MNRIIENMSSSLFYDGSVPDYQNFLRFIIDPELTRIQNNLSATINFYKDHHPHDGTYYNREKLLPKFKKINGVNKN